MKRKRPGRKARSKSAGPAVDLHGLALDMLRRPDEPNVKRRAARLTEQKRMSIMYELVLADREIKGLPPPGPMRRDCMRIIRPGQPTIIIRGSRRREVPCRPKP